MVRPTNLEIHQRSAGPALVLAVTGELDMNTVEMLATGVEQQLASGPRSLTLDLSELEFMDSSGLRLLIELYDRSKSEPWELKLVAPRSDAAATVLRATGADSALPFASDGPS